MHLTRLCLFLLKDLAQMYQLLMKQNKVMGTRFTKFLSAIIIFLIVKNQVLVRSTIYIGIRMPKKTLKTCSRGHEFYKSSDCPVCPKCWPGFYEKNKSDFPKLAAPAL